MYREASRFSRIQEHVGEVFIRNHSWFIPPADEPLAKRPRPPSISSLRDRGVEAPAIVGALAASAGLAPAGSRVMPADLVATFDWGRVPSTTVTLDEGLLSMRAG